MKKTILGMIIAVVSLILVQSNMVAIGLPGFIIGIILMYGGQWPRR